MATIHYTGELVVVTCWCGMPHAVPKELRDYQIQMHRDGRSIDIYCPLGHGWVPAGEGEAARLQRQLVAERARQDQLRAQIREAEKQQAALKGELTKTKKRVGNGVCPCCSRSFQDLHRHMKSKHPGFATA